MSDTISGVALRGKEEGGRGQDHHIIMSANTVQNTHTRQTEAISTVSDVMEKWRQ